MIMNYIYTFFTIYSEDGEDIHIYIYMHIYMKRYVQEINDR